MLFPYQHPLCAFPTHCMGLYSHSISHQKFHQAGTCHCRCVCGWSGRGPRCACPAALGER